ncbi:MAG TPA: hypothetical protein VGI58_01885 [Streptosporangiaceae bacterium]
MSASDAAPLPRLGEVFFDVRGNSRSMRLSWYADTDVAVFSIWQGGRCTGTFRLPIADLGRMIELLQRGPDGRGRPDGPPGYGSELDEFDDRQPGQLGAADRAYHDADFGDRDFRDRALQDTQLAGGDWDAGQDTDAPGGGGPAWPARGGDYHDDRYPGRSGPGGDYRGHEAGGAYPARREPAEDDYWDDDPGYPAPVGGRGRFSGADLPGQGTRDGGTADPRFADTEYADADFGRGPADGDYADMSRPGYGDEHFVPPYVRGQDEAYPNDNTVVASGQRGSYDPRAYPDDRPAPSRRGSHHREQTRSDDPYYDEPDYRLSAHPAGGSSESAGRHGSR